MSADSLHHVVILGAGFGGLGVALGLAKAPVRITIVDRRNHHDRQLRDLRLGAH